jgi:hypothetical protein
MSAVPNRAEDFGRSNAIVLDDGCDPSFVTLYEAWLAKTGDACAAATMVLATVQAQQLIPREIDDPLIGLDEAAKYLGYKPAGLRKIVKQQQIQYVQNGRGPIKFKRDWLDEYIASNAAGPKDIERSRAQKRSRPIRSAPSRVFDPVLFYAESHSGAE